VGSPDLTKRERAMVAVSSDSDHMGCCRYNIGLIEQSLPEGKGTLPVALCAAVWRVV